MKTPISSEKTTDPIKNKATPKILSVSEIG